MKIFDTHCHLANKELRPEAEALAERAFASGVQGLAIIAADEQSLIEAPLTVAALKNVYPGKIAWSAGIHPHDADDFNDGLKSAVAKAAEQADAVGETGLDYHYDHSDRKVQQEAFAWHIALAAKLSKPLVIHCREAAEDVLRLLDVPSIQNHPNPGILHCFAEDEIFARKVLDLGFYISFSGILTFKNADRLRGVLKMVPLDRILVETDSPWLAPIPHRGKRNEPAFTKDVLTFLLTQRPESPELIEDTLWENSCRVFGLNPSGLNPSGLNPSGSDT